MVFFYIWMLIYQYISIVKNYKNINDLEYITTIKK